MKNYFKYLFLLAVLVITCQQLQASGADSGFTRLRDYIAKKIDRQVKENEERVKKGLPKNLIVFADARELNGRAPGEVTGHVQTVPQSNTSMETLQAIWDFNNNEQLKKLSAELNAFSEKNKYDYYIVIAAIYNIEENETENTDFSKVAWKEIDDMNKVNTVRQGDPNKALQYYTTNGQDKFNKLAKMVRNKLQNKASNALYHFIITTYFPVLPDKTETLVGRVAHLQTIFNSDPTGNNVYNDAFTNYWTSHAQSKSDKIWTNKENWLLSATSDLQDFIANIRNFKETDFLAIKTPTQMVTALKQLKNPDVLLSGISFVTRKHIITVLNEGKLTDDYWILPPVYIQGEYGGENAMLKVIKTTPGKQSDSLVNLLKENSYQLLKDLDSKFDDAGMWGTRNNYTKFVQSLTAVLVAGMTPQKLADLMSKGFIFNLLISGNDKRLVNYFTNNIQQEYDKQVNTNSGAIQRKFARVNVSLDDLTKYWISTYTETVKTGDLAEQYNTAVSDATKLGTNIDLKQFDEKAPGPSSVQFDPFQMIVVVPQKDFDINGFSLTRNDFQPIPLYYYYWLRRKHDNEQWMYLAEEAGDALMIFSMFTGIGEMMEGGKLAVQAIRAARILFDAKMLLNSASEGRVDEWLKEKMGEGFFKIYKFVEYAYLTYAMTRGGIVLVNGMGKVLGSAVATLYNLIRNSPELMAQLRTSPEYFTAFRNYFKEALGKDLEAVAEGGSGVGGTVAQAGFLSFSDFFRMLRSKYPKLYDKFTTMSQDLQKAFAAKYGEWNDATQSLMEDVSKALTAFNKNLKYLEEWKYWQGLPKTPVTSWEEAVKTVEGLLTPHVNKLKALYPNAKIGYRGSLATKIKYKTGADFDPAKYDCDAFIVSDKLAALSKKARGFRDGAEVSREIEEACDAMEEAMKRTGGYKWEPGKPFSFRVFTEAEFIEDVVPKGYKLLYNGK